jgi:Ca2+-binding RTX toxin-like protein
MSEVYKPFSAPQKEEYIRRFYENVGDYLSLSFDDSKIKALVLEPKVLSFSWSIDGKVSGTTDTLNLETLMSVPAVLDATPKHQEITVATVDSSGMIRKESIIESTKQNEKIDLLLGSNKADRIIGTSKNEVIIAGRGNDKLMGGSGDDILIGGLGDDILIGGTGNNFIDGGAGNDTAIYNGSLSDFSLSKGSDSSAIT